MAGMLVALVGWGRRLPWHASPEGKNVPQRVGYVIDLDLLILSNRVDIFFPSEVLSRPAGGTSLEVFLFALDPPKLPAFSFPSIAVYTNQLFYTLVPSSAQELI